MDKKYTFITSKSGETIPVINGLPLHSTIDPVREAKKLLGTVPDGAGFLIFLGLGGGFAPLAASQKNEAEVIVIDYGIKELLASNDYSALLDNKRFTLLQDPANEEIQNFILKNYKPALHGGIKVLPLRTRVDFNKEIFESAANSIQQAVLQVSSDYSVQAHFGKRWFCNIIRNVFNMRNINNCNIFPEEIKNAAVIAAGPSLDNQIDALMRFKERNGFIISSDTALGALLKNGIKPDTVVSIDCQYKSYYHFLGQNEIRDIPLVLDIASPAMLTGLSSAPVLFASGHPFASYISENRLQLPKLDTSGGNVTYACFSLAQTLGAETITLFGADFAYIRSQSYARGTYVLPYFEERQNRFNTLESQSSAFLYRVPFLEAEPGQEYKETAQLKFYRECLETKAGVKIKPGCGAPIQIRNQQHRIVRINPNKNNISPIEFLKNYRDKIENLTNTNDRLILTTLLPYAAYLRNRNPELKTKDLLEETKRCCVKEINLICN